MTKHPLHRHVPHRGRRWLLSLLSCMVVWGSHTPPSGAVEHPKEPTETAAESSFTLRGFGTLGVARSSSDQMEFVRDLSQPRGISNHWSGRIDSVIGLQANWQATRELELVGQVVSRYQYNESRDPEVMWGFVKWDIDGRAELRAGRLGADFLMGADSRLVGYSYVPVRPSVDYFGPLLFSYFDGADASATFPVAGGLLRTKAYAGLSREKGSSGGMIWDASDSILKGLVFDYFTGPWQVRASATHVRLSRDMPFEPLPSSLRAAGAALGIPQAIDAANALAVGGSASQFMTVGMVYDDGPLQVQGMVNTIHHGTGAFENSQAGYLLGAYRLGAITPYVGYSWWKSKSKRLTTGLPNTGALIALNQGFDSVLRDSASDQKTYTLGARWDIMPDVALKAQWDAVHGKPRSIFPYRAEKPGWTGHTHIFSLTLDFVF